MQKILEIEFQNTFVENFPGDNSLEQYCRETPNVLYAVTHPTKVSHPELLAWSKDLAWELGILSPETPEEVAIISGNAINPSMIPYSARYGGHQFGHWAQQLGDGRAITLGEIFKADNKIFEIQLKGAGPTPYSRRGDGRAVLRSSLREFLMSEAMFYLNVPTTRALSLVTTGDDIVRDMFYDGRPQYEKGAIVARVAPSFLRFGNFEILFAMGEIQNLKDLCDWTVNRFYPEIKNLKTEEKIQEFFKYVCEKSLTMVIEWMRVGFVHGVMNSDNMSILGLTIDYGPFSMMDKYLEDFTPNTTDLPGRRYAFIKQPSIVFWNLERLATALSPLISDKNILINYLEEFEGHFKIHYYKMMEKKLGLFNTDQESLVNLVNELSELLIHGQFDMTNFYTQLSLVSFESEWQEKLNILKVASYKKFSTDDIQRIKGFLTKYQNQISVSHIEERSRHKLMRENNPLFVLRNYLLHQCALELEKGDTKLLKRLQSAIANPYNWDLFKADPELLNLAPEWASHTPGCSTLSCSS